MLQAVGAQASGEGAPACVWLSHSLALFTFLCLYFLFCVMGTARRDLDMT